MTTAAHELPAGTRLPSGSGFSTVLPDLDFETYSEAGYRWDAAAKTWRPLHGATKGGLSAVGACVYSEHPTAEVLSLAYNLKDGTGEKLWLPGMPPPVDLFDHIARGGLLEAWNCTFEYYIWLNVCTPRMGWPQLPLDQLRDAMAKSRAFAYPGALAKACEVSGAAIQKDKEGSRLIRKFCVPRKPTAKDKRTRIRPESDPVDGPKLYDYNRTDIRSEASVSALIPDLSPEEEIFWQHTTRSNVRGVAVDLPAVDACIEILEQAYRKYNLELANITAGAVAEASKVAQLLAWCNSQGVPLGNLDDEAITNTLGRADLPRHVRRALEIRQMVGSAGVKKVYAMKRQANRAQRLCDLFIYHGARTGRDTGADVQPQNLVKAGPKLRWCEDATCRKPYAQHLTSCPHCGTSDAFSKATGWGWEAVDHAVAVLKTGSLAEVERIFGDAVLTISGCIRGLFIAGPGKDLICSDYSSIEAVVIAMLAGEQWRIDAFRRKEDIYLVSAGRITGTTLEEYLQYEAEHGEKHPDRQKIGKPAELGLGFGGWINAWYQFDKSGTFTEDEVKRNIIAWRDASPAIVELWGGQVRGKPWAPEKQEYYGLEGAAIMAVLNPGQCYQYRGIVYGVKDDVLYCQLLSGRKLTYHRPRLQPSTRWEGQLELSFEGWNSNPKTGPTGWLRMGTYGGRLAENVVQAIARDILAHGVDQVERAGYTTVLRVHDELVAEIERLFGSIEEFERLMATLPAWCADWPIRAAGGWRGKRYRKD